MHVRVTEVVETKEQGKLFKQIAMMTMNIDVAYLNGEPGGIYTMHISFRLHITNDTNANEIALSCSCLTL